MQDDQIKWIWLPEWGAEDKERPILALFLKKVKLQEEPARAEIRISADTRYKLYINGELAEMGPDRGDCQIWFYDSVDIRKYLHRGENVLAVQVLRYPMEYRKGNYGMFRTEYPGLYVEGSITDTVGNRFVLDADESWMCCVDEGFEIVSEAEDFAPLQIYENRRGIAGLKGWMLPGYDAAGWMHARPYRHISRMVSPGNMKKRSIPFLYRKRRRFQGVAALRKSLFDRCRWEDLLLRDREIVIPAHTREVLEITAGEEMTAYITLALQRGAGTEITLLQSEGYVQDAHHKNLPVKKNRNDQVSGHLEGFEDHYRVAGYGCGEILEEYEPFWFRTFRFIRVEIETGEEPLTISRLDYTETGYPLEILTRAVTSDASLIPVWKISERTLRRCMHETYEDCPFYEQQQYIMDARVEILYTYAVSADDRLARKCMDDFRRSQRYDGLLNASYPCCRPNVIPGFSIYYILMLHDHMMYFGDKDFLEMNLPAVFGILNYFHRHLTKEGYVAKLGGLNGKDANWSFIDWVPEWDDTTGAPDAVLEGPITMESLLYVMGLQHAAGILDYMGYAEWAALYLGRAEAVQHALLRYAMGKNGMLQDGPGVEKYSQHVQVFSVLTETVPKKQGRKNLEETLLYPDKYPQCSVAMAFYLFRAMQMTDLYVLSQEYWDIWRRMLKKGLTTCVEDEVGERSDCHGWGALLLYELPAVILGVQPAKPGYKAISIRPEPGYLEYAEGSVITPAGVVKVAWDVRDGGKFIYEAPAGTEVIADATALEKMTGYYKMM